MSPEKQSASVVPVGHLLGNKFLSFAKSRLPVPNRPKPRAQRRALRVDAPIPFAPLVDTHAFQPPPPYSARPDDAVAFLPVPHNTPEEPTLVTATAHGVPLGAAAQPLGLGLDGVEKGDGGRFDGLGRLSCGFRGAGGGPTSDALREEVHHVLTERSQRRRTRASEQPAMCHDVFYAAVEVQAASSVPARTVQIRIRRGSVASPTPGAGRWDAVRRSTISSELKRAASLERRASQPSETMNAWRV